ncbi:MAG TPA: cytochrome c oxidase subunit 3 [Polyangia bacterium]|jgi:heme/copper-type cytochrome/quinol oxidase subunit 3|nr:cytochrome c oxidase subunit 3 [Polyangia bacterium]
MTASAVLDDRGEETAPRIDALPPDESRGTMGMKLVIVTEALLFLTLFFAYFYIGHRHPIWPDEPPKLRLALALLAILLVSSGTLQLSEQLLGKGRRLAARLLLLLTLVLGLGFVALQTLEYRNHLRELRPTDDVYGSLFYVITSFHGLHVVAGLLMLGFVAVLPSLTPSHSPHRPLHNAALYWHFVDVIWILVVGILYLLPRWVR